MVVCRETVLNGIYHVHNVKDAAIIRVALRGGVATTVCPGGEVLEVRELGAEGLRDVRLG